MFRRSYNASGHVGTGHVGFKYRRRRESNPRVLGGRPWCSEHRRISSCATPPRAIADHDGITPLPGQVSGGGAS